MNRYLIPALMVWSVLGGPVRAQHLSWQSHTAVSQTTDLCVSGNRVWAATSGGLRAIDQETGVQQIWTNTEGLASNTLLALTPDGRGGVWLGHASGQLQHYDVQENRFSTINDYENHPVSCLLAVGDTLWVGLDIGVSLYLLDRSEVKETYRRFGTFPADLRVNALSVAAGQLWVGTDAGAARAALSQSNLLDPASWETFDETQGLPDQRIRDLSASSFGLAAATSQGAALFSNEVWTVLHAGDVRAVLSHASQLYTASATGVRLWDGNQLISVGENGYSFSRLAGSDQALYGSNAVLRVLPNGENQWQEMPASGLAGNWVSGIALDDNQQIWTTHRDGGISIYREGLWETRTPQSLAAMNSRDWTCVATDVHGNVWAGSWGEGLLCFKADNSEILAYHTENSVLSGISENHNYAVITGLFVDSYGTLWILNYRADDGNALVAVDTQGIWTEYGRSEGLNSTLVRAITEDPFGRKWVGTEQGLYLLEDRGTPSNKGDDPSVRYFTTADGLLSNDVRALATAPDGIVYVGSASGVNTLYDVQFSTLFNIPVESVSSLAVDGAGNLWAGTQEGLAFFSPQSYTWTLYQTEDGLAHDQINALTMDSDHGILYIGTNGGLSVVQTPYSNPSEKMGELTAYPNPFKPAQDLEVAIEGLGANVQVSVFNGAGFEVRHYSEEAVLGKRLIWDGKDNHGQAVPSGIYVVVGVNESGAVQKGKLTLIR